EGASEGRPVIDRIGVGTSPRPKGSRLPSGVDARERTANRRWAAKQNCRRGCKGPCPCGCHHPGTSGDGSVRVPCRGIPTPMGFAAGCKKCVGSCLSRMHRKGARPVLRGGGGGDATSLPDQSLSQGEPQCSADSLGAESSSVSPSA